MLDPFVVSLVLSLLSLWFAIGLFNFPAVLISKHKEINDIAGTDRTKLPDFVASLWQSEIVPDDKRSRRLLLAAFVFYAVALLVLVIVGLWQFVL
jgi:hypothetical protein